MKFSKRKWKALPLRRNNSRHTPGAYNLESNSAEKVQGVDTKLIIEPAMNLPANNSFLGEMFSAGQWRRSFSSTHPWQRLLWSAGNSSRLLSMGQTWNYWIKSSKRQWRWLKNRSTSDTKRG